MSEKDGTVEQNRSVLFGQKPAIGTSTCPFKSLEVAIVPVRYALDRSRYDASPGTLKPLPKAGKWAELPELKTRAYTLRQLYDGYVYVFDETDRTFHEYAVNAVDASLTRIVWTDTHLGQDSRSGVGEAKPHLLYPRLNRLHLAFSPMQWTWRLCEHMRSNANSRAKWMKPLDLAGFCTTMAEPGTLPLRQIAEAVADIDAGSATHDQRFDDSSVPTSGEGMVETDTGCKPQFSPVGADVHWLGSVPDKNSALLIALDDPLAMLNDLGLQLAADQAAYRVWQDEHGHKVQMAKTVANLCASSDDPDGLPVSVKGDVRRTQAYLSERDEYLDQLQLETEAVTSANHHNSFVGSDFFKSSDMKNAFLEKYNIEPTTKDSESWKHRAKWRREIDLKGARAYISSHQPTADKLLQQVRDTQSDFQVWADHIGLDPAVLFVDTTNVKSLLYLQTVMSELLTVYSQDIDAHDWLLEQENTASSLFGTLRYGFSPAIKEALHQEADNLLKGMNDYTNLATRAGEINAALNHPDVAESAWMKKLTQSARDTYGALRELASGKGKAVAESIIVAMIPIDARHSKGKQKDLLALFRSFMIGQVLMGSPHKLAIDSQVGEKINQWKNQQTLLNNKITTLRNNWLHPHTKYDRKSISHQISQVDDAIQKHQLQLPLILDFQEKQYALALQNEMRSHVQSGTKNIKNWELRAKEWISRLGAATAAAITWGVIMINFINTALLYDELTRDGEFSERDMVKIGYGLGYSVNLLIGVYVEAPWLLIRTAQPVIINGSYVTILERSASYWTAHGNNIFANAIKGFRVTMIAMGAAGMIAAALEIYDLTLDYANGKTQTEKTLIAVKAASVAAMYVGAMLQVVAGIFPKTIIAVFVINPWFTFALMIAGLVYLLSTMIINYLQMDSIGWWLRKSCWSLTQEYRYPDTIQGHENEAKALREIQLSPSIFVKRTTERRREWPDKAGYVQAIVQTGAWIQILLPSAARGRSVYLNVISSEKPLGVLSVEQSRGSITQHFISNGIFLSPTSFANINEKQHAATLENSYFPELPPASDNITWQTWVPLSSTAGFIELQLWHPKELHGSDTEEYSYLYQIKLTDDGDSAVDGLITTQLLVQHLGRESAATLEVPSASVG